MDFYSFTCSSTFALSKSYRRICNPQYHAIINQKWEACRYAYRILMYVLWIRQEEDFMLDSFCLCWSLPAVPSQPSCLQETVNSCSPFRGLSALVRVLTNHF
jgi:hypothetical protein